MQPGKRGLWPNCRLTEGNLISLSFPFQKILNVLSNSDLISCKQMHVFDIEIHI